VRWKLGVEEIPLAAFRERWLPGMGEHGIRVGINWSGERATGYNLPAAEVEQNLAATSAGW
jgi:hypothetical protein